MIIKNIRDDDPSPGLREYEVNLLMLIEKISNGVHIHINDTGTKLKYKPGILICGDDIEHECSMSRPVGYYIELLLCLAPFAQKPLDIILSAPTNGSNYLSCEGFEHATFPLMKQFGIDAPKITIQRRAFPIRDGDEKTFVSGSVRLYIPVVRSLQPVQMLDVGRVKRIRGMAVSTIVNVCPRLVDSAREILNKLLPDVYIDTDHIKKRNAGSSPGYSLSLVAESTTSCRWLAELASESGDLPEDLGDRVSKTLLQEISQGGIIDSSHQAMTFLFMVLCPEDVSTIRVGKLTKAAISSLRLLRDFFGVIFKVETEAKSVIMTCKGVGFSNIAKPIA